MLMVMDETSHADTPLPTANGVTTQHLSVRSFVMGMVVVREKIGNTETYSEHEERSQALSHLLRLEPARETMRRMATVRPGNTEKVVKL